MIKLILPAKDIPADSVVTKVNGSVLFYLRDQIEIFAYGTKSAPRPDSPSPLQISGGRFLVQKDGGNISAVSEDQELTWHCYDLEDLKRWVENQEDSE